MKGLSLSVAFDFGVLGAVFLTAVYAHIRRRKQALRPPPGPQGYPVIGNIFGIPSEDEGRKYRDWSAQYDSDIVSTHLLGVRIIVLNSAEAIADLFEQRSSIYSGRPNIGLTMFCELMGFDWTVALLDYGQPWRAARKLMHQEFHPQATLRYRPHQVKAACNLLSNLLESPDDFRNHLHHMAGESIMAITYGIEVKPTNDPYIEMAKHVTKATEISLVPGGFLVNVLPSLKHIPEWFPGAGFQKTARFYREWGIKLLQEPFQEVKRNLESGQQVPCFVSYCLSKTGPDARMEKAIQATAATMYGAGSDTSTITISSALLGLLSNPAAVKEAQKQIDLVVGNHRLPNFSDQDSLTWITAITKEALRWNPTSPLGLPHRVTTGDMYKGYHLPEGSIIYGNMWALLYDERAYPEPEKFNPARFLKDGKMDPDIKDPDTAAFGFGRRICPGRFMAESSLWITVANILAVFDISKAINDDGTVDEPLYESRSGLLRYPKPFRCVFKPRSANATQLIKESNLSSL